MQQIQREEQGVWTPFPMSQVKLWGTGGLDPIPYVTSQVMIRSVSGRLVAFLCSRFRGGNRGYGPPPPCHKSSYDQECKWQASCFSYTADPEGGTGDMDPIPHVTSQVMIRSVSGTVVALLCTDPEGGTGWSGPQPLCHKSSYDQEC